MNHAIDCDILFAGRRVISKAISVPIKNANKSLVSLYLTSYKGRNLSLFAIFCWSRQLYRINALKLVEELEALHGIDINSRSRL